MTTRHTAAAATVSPASTPTAATAAPSSSSSSGKKRKVVCVHLLNGSELAVYVDVKSKYQEVFNQVAGHLSLRETEYFGLAFKKDNEYHFIVLDEKIHKLAPKHWKSGSGEGLDSQGKPIINVWFRVQFYVDQVVLLREKVTRHQYYLQLKDNVLQYNLLYNEEKCFALAAYALQADCGNYIAEKFQDGYFNPGLYFPFWMIERHGMDYLVKNTPVIHQDLRNMTRNEAELRYIRNATMHPGAHNLHFYTVRKRKTDKECNTWLALGAKGVDVFEDDAGYKNHISTFLWKDIGKLYFDKKRFEIRSVQIAGGRRFMYYTDCDIKSKYLLNICRITHMFQMAIQPKLMEIQHLDNEDLKRCRESYNSNDGRDNRGQYGHSGHSPSKSIGGNSTNNSNNNNTQRFSVISDASSNTTSGIVSDRMAVSFDDGDDHSREIMIDCPPRSMMYGTPSQSASKFHLLSNPHSFKQSPSSSKSSPNLIPQSLDFYKHDAVCNPSPQELSPTSSNGSWRARHSQPLPGCVKGGNFPLPSPTGPSHDASLLYGLRRSLGRKESFSKQFLLSALDKNTSGDSAVSVSGFFGGNEKVPPLSLPQPELNVFPGSSHSGNSTSTTLPLGSRMSGGNSPGVSLPLNHLKKQSTPSPPTTLTFTPPTHGKKPSPLLHTAHSFSKHQDLLEGRDAYAQRKNSPREMHRHYRSMNSPRETVDNTNITPRRTGLEQLNKPPVSPKDNNNEHIMYSPFEATVGTSHDVLNEQLNNLQVSHGIQDLRPPPPPVAQLYVHPDSQNMSSHHQPHEGGLNPLNICSSVDQYTVHPDDHHNHMPADHGNLPSYEEAQKTNPNFGQYSQLQLQQQQTGHIHHHHHHHHLLPEPQQPPPPPLPQQQQLQFQQQQQSPASNQQQQQQQQQQQPPKSSSSKKTSPITEHYLLALQTSPHLSERLAAPRMPVQEMMDKINSHTKFPHHHTEEDYLKDHYRQYQLQQQVHEDKSNEVRNVQQVREEDENKENVNTSHPSNGNASHTPVINKANDAEEEERRDELGPSSGGKQRSHTKSVLHPELKQILGQSQAISLPLITALCNDSTLMQASRSTMSGSRSSYDTSTIRSTDSRLTRFSHDTDPRRWSSCGQTPGNGDTKSQSQSSRPYSWHSEHFDLDDQLALPPTDHLSPTPPNPRSLKNKHMRILENVSNVPQKMIESDPGPSSPRILNTTQVSWWDYPHSMNGSEPGSTASWADIIPYSLPSQLNKHCSSSGCVSTGSHHSSSSHQHMVPHKLSSGGHRDSDSSITHQQMMKENIGLA